MSTRIVYLSIAAFWVTMNFFLWRVEYSSHGGGEPVPVELVWRKILTAPDASSLSICQRGERSGFCEFSTSVETEMAKLDEDKPPPEGLVARAGYLIHLNGNTSLGDFTNRLRFDGRLQFSARRQWRELTLKLSTRSAMVEIHSFATNQTVHLKISNDDGVSERDFAFADLASPGALLGAFGASFGGDGLLDTLDTPSVPQSSAAIAQEIHWEAHRDRLKIGSEPVSVYRLETHVLGYAIIIYASTLGEILRVELPDDLTATLDEWTKS
jgi:hypothetical protein